MSAIPQDLSFEAVVNSERVSTECGTEFEIQVEYTVVDVSDCAAKTSDEQTRMIRGINFELAQKAEAACKGNDACPWWKVVRGEVIDNVCGPNTDGRNIWTTKWRFSVKCVP